MNDAGAQAGSAAAPRPAASAQRIVNVPNALSAYRLVAIPFILWALAAGARTAFAVLILVNLVTDILDGLLARLLRQQTALGARLDSAADIGTFAMAVAGLLVFERGFAAAHWPELALLVGLFVLPQTLCFLRHRRPMAMHLYSSKVSGYAQGIFFVLLFFFGYSPAVFYAMLAIACLNGLEETVVLILSPRRLVDARGLYWVLKGSARG